MIIENFPSRAEFYSLFDKFLEVNKIILGTDEYNIEHKQNSIETVFEKEVLYWFNQSIALEFLKFVNLQKINNPLYNKIKANLIFNVNKEKNIETITHTQADVKITKSLSKFRSYNKIRLVNFYYN